MIRCHWTTRHQSIAHYSGRTWWPRAGVSGDGVPRGPPMGSALHRSCVKGLPLKMGGLWVSVLNSSERVGAVRRRVEIVASRHALSNSVDGSPGRPAGEHGGGIIGSGAAAPRAASGAHATPTHVLLRLAAAGPPPQPLLPRYRGRYGSPRSYLLEIRRMLCSYVPYVP